MDKKPIQLTEQDIHFLVENAVQAYLTENGMEEGILGGISNVARKGVNAAQRGLTNARGRIKKAATNAYNNVTGATNNMYNNVKTAYNQGSAQQDLQNVNNALRPMVDKGILDAATYKQILGRLNTAIIKQGGQKMQGLA